MAYEFITYDEREKVGLLTLNRPEKRNALSLELMKEFAACMKAVGEGPAKVIIVKGAGEQFCAGHDLNEILAGKLADIRHIFENCINLMALIQGVPQVVIAQVQGVATAAGCQLVAACDLAVAEENARFATPGVKIGLFCSTPMVPLSRAVGRKRALEMLLTGKFISAEAARDFGLLNHVVSPERLEEETRKLADDIACYSAVTLGIGKRGFYRQINMADSEAYEFAKEVISANAVMDDAREGISAFLEKRRPDWKEKK